MGGPANMTTVVLFVSELENFMELLMNLLQSMSDISVPLVAKALN